MKLVLMIILAQAGVASTSYRDSVGAWGKCAFEAVGDYVTMSDEPATTIVTAALGKCQREEAKVQQVIEKLFPDDIEAQRDAMKDSRLRMERRLTALTLELRAIPKP